MLLIASLILTFGNSFILMLLYKCVHEIAVMFLNMDEIILKNNLNFVNRKVKMTSVVFFVILSNAVFY